MDLPEAGENLRALEQRFPEREVVAISAERADGIAELRERLAQWLSDKTGESPSAEVAETAQAVAAE
jgi:50S ribosomal subunit-associated GTPase HflX